MMDSAGPPITAPEALLGSPGPISSGERTRRNATLRWALRRVLLSIFVLFGVSLLVFVATQALPGDPAVQILGHGALPEQLAALRAQLDRC